MLSAAARSRHSSNKINNLDPDDGNSWLCSACKLPIFATPFIGGGGAALLHDQCANLPEVLNDCELHPEKSLLLSDHNINNQQTCSECSQICGTKLYYCPDSDCGLVLDVACALPIKILHRSHDHRLMAVRSGARSSGAICDVCGAAHDEAAAAVAELRSRSYFCNVCGFWIHPKCAALPSVIEHEKHEHPLVLYYDLHATFGAHESTPTNSKSYICDLLNSELLLQNNEIFTRTRTQTCAICGDNVANRCGIYSCISCRDYVIHVKCAKTLKSVSFGEARFSRLVRLPPKDEHESVLRYAVQTRNESIREPFTLHDRDDDIIISDDDDDDQDPRCGRRLRVCDICIKIIDTPPFYSSSLHPNFFLHDYCRNLSRLLEESSTHKRGHRFIFVLKDSPVHLKCHHCRCRINRAYYRCRYKLCSIALHVWCALMPGVITHDATHFLRLTYEASSNSLDRGCYCCNLPLGKVTYECRTCPNFAIHTWCALLPRTFTHKFDPHPLTLTTTTAAAAGVDIEKMICEICENGMKGGIWCYSCQICDQWFHIDCIPCLELTYKIKSQANSGQLLRDCVPTRLIRGLTLEGHAHDYCAHVADEYDILASY